MFLPTVQPVCRTEENNSSVFLYNTQTQESWWFGNADNVSEIHLDPERVVALDAMPDIGLGMPFHTVYSLMEKRIHQITWMSTQVPLLVSMLLLSMGHCCGVIWCPMP